MDPQALDDASGARGWLAIDVDPAWLAAGDTVEITIPGRLRCARCDGGGCDGCDRSGAVRPREDTPRTIRVTLPRATGPVLVRIAAPLGEEAGLAQLVLEVRPGTPAPDLRRIEPPPAARSSFVSFAIAAVLVLLATLFFCSR